MFSIEQLDAMIKSTKSNSKSLMDLESDLVREQILVNRAHAACVVAGNVARSLYDTKNNARHELANLSDFADSLKKDLHNQPTFDSACDIALANRDVDDARIAYELATSNSAIADLFFDKCTNAYVVATNVKTATLLACRAFRKVVA